MHDGTVLFIDEAASGFAIGHRGYVAGRYRDGALSNIWTDVRRCAERTFVAYRPACECGWLGPAMPATAEGHLACLRCWAIEHGPPASAVLAGALA